MCCSPWTLRRGVTLYSSLHPPTFFENVLAVLSGCQGLQVTVPLGTRVWQPRAWQECARARNTQDCALTNMMYVFVEISIDVAHFAAMVRQEIPSSARAVFVSTIQFVGSLRVACEKLKDHFTHPITVPQNRPLSGGELLGCTSPKMPDEEYDVVVYLGDGRFHLESFMIANPDIAAYKYGGGEGANIESLDGEHLTGCAHQLGGPTGPPNNGMAEPGVAVDVWPCRMHSEPNRMRACSSVMWYVWVCLESWG